MYSTNFIEIIFLIAAFILYILGLYFVFMNRKLKVPGIMFLVFSILYFGLSFLIFYNQLKINNINSTNSSTVKSIKNVISTGSTPVISSSVTPSRFLNIPVTQVQKMPIQSAAAIILSNLSQNTGSSTSFSITAKVDNPKPTSGQSVNVIITGPPSASVYATANYKNASVSNSGIIDSNGIGKISFAMGNSNPGDAVKIDVNAVLNNNTATAQTSFTEAN
jgi:hypothetical protein